MRGFNIIINSLLLLSFKKEKEKKKAINELCAYFIFGWLEGAKKKLKAGNSFFTTPYLQMSEERQNLRFFCARTVPIKASTLKKQKRKRTEAHRFL